MPAGAVSAAQGANRCGGSGSGRAQLLENRAQLLENRARLGKQGSAREAGLG